MQIKVDRQCPPDAETTSDCSNRSNLSHEQLLDCVEVGKAITAELDPARLLPIIMEKVSRLLPSQTWSLLLLDEQSEMLRFEICINLDPLTVRNFRLPLGQGVAGQAALQQRLIVVEDVAACEYFDRTVDKASGHMTESLICAPVLFGGRTLGVLELVNPESINPTIISLLTLLADYTAIAVENTRRYKQMQEMAVHDNLTGLYNQRYLYQKLKQMMPACREANRPISLIFMDMDDFKEVVDRLGHLNGSRALHEVAQRISRHLAKPAFGVAYGGDEFVCVLPDADHHQAVKVADALRQAVKSGPYLTQWGHEVNLTASFGVATFPQDAEDCTELLAFADQAMFRAKNT
ncbi:MAG: sensor domain-containing diguanylate cyclase, partial [Desulfosarcinaceae bacterium]